MGKHGALFARFLCVAESKPPRSELWASSGPLCKELLQQFFCVAELQPPQSERRHAAVP